MLDQHPLVLETHAVRQPVGVDRAARWGAYGCGALVAGLLGHFLLGIPVQFSDSFGNMLKLSMSWTDLLRGEFTQHGYLRPMLWATLKVVYDLAGDGSYFAWFRGAHVLQVLALALLYVALVRPRTWRDTALVPIGLAALVSMHTFTGTVVEAFPINTFLTILVICFAAAALSLARYRWWNDVLAVLLFVIAALTVETGLLVGVIVIGAALTGARGVSRGGVLLVILLMAGYFYLRFAVLGVGSPGLVERSSGFGFGMLDPGELTRRFGANPAGFYLYNIVTSALSVLFSEPSGGVFGLTSAVLNGRLTPSMFTTLIASTSATLLVASYAWRRRSAWRAWQLDRDDRLVLLFLLVLAANAVISYPYTKDVIMSPAGAFLAVAMYVGGRSALASLDARSVRHPFVLVAASLIVGVTWTNQYVDSHLALRQAAFTTRTEWAYIDSTLREQHTTLDDRERRLLDRLRDDALVVHPAPPPIALPFTDLFGEE